MMLISKIAGPKVLQNPTVLHVPATAGKHLLCIFAGDQGYDQASCIRGKEEASRPCQPLPRGKFLHGASASTISLMQARFTHNSPQNSPGVKVFVMIRSTSVTHSSPAPAPEQPSAWLSEEIASCHAAPMACRSLARADCQIGFCIGFITPHFSG